MPAGWEWALGFLLVVGGLAAAGMMLAWRKRSQKGVQYDLEDNVGDIIASFDDVFFVAVTPVGEPLVRVNIPGLSYRGPARVAIHSEGITCEVKGETRKTVPRAAITEVYSARTRIDKTVEKDGLAIASWKHLDDHLELVIRFPEVADHIRFIQTANELITASAQKENEE